MTTSLSQLQAWMNGRENERLECKEAKNRFDFEELVKYCAAIANEGGGKILFGVTDLPPRRVVGTRAFPQPERTNAAIIERLHLRTEIEELSHPNGTLVVIHIPPRPRGVPIQYKGAYWMRAGEELAPMTPDMLKRIFDEATPDFSALINPEARFSDLDPAAIEQFRELWSKKSQNRALASLSHDRLLADAELVQDGCVTNAALILCGTHKALNRRLPQAEIVFEYRSSEASIAFQQREDYRQGFLLFRDEIWKTINLRNDRQSFQNEFQMLDIPTFNERVVREAILNAVCHRDYQHPESTFIRQFPKKLEVISPGGFPAGVTPENILYRQERRNRLIAESFARCGLIERSGQGVDLMFQECIRESKQKPDFSRTDAYQVWLTLPGEIQDSRFLRFLEKVGHETLASFNIEDFLVLDMIHQDQRVPDSMRQSAHHLVENGVIESVGGGKHLLSRKFYRFLGKTGTFTRKRGLNRETNKALLVRHVVDNNEEGSRLEDLMQVLPSLTRRQVQELLRELKEEGVIESRGRTRAALWYGTKDCTVIARNSSRSVQ